MKVVFTMANNSSVPYFNWFAERAYQQSEVEFIFVCLTPRKPQMIEDVGRWGWKCYWVKFNADSRKRSMPAAFFDLLRLFKKIKPDVVHAHLFDDAVPALLAARILKIKRRIITKADAGFHFFYTPKWVWIDKLNNLAATDIVCISSENKDFVLAKERAPLHKLRLIHHGVPVALATHQDKTKIIFLRDKYQLHNKTIIGTVARLIEWKGYRYIIQAAREVVKSHRNVIFLFVGVGEQEQELQALVHEAGIEEYIVFTGWVDRDLIPSLYGLMDIYVHAAAYEPFGFVIAEAMLNSLPLVTTKSGAALDAVVHKENGYLVDHKDAKGLAEGIEYILSEADRKEMGRRAYETAFQMFNFERMYLDHMQLYKSLKTD